MSLVAIDLSPVSPKSAGKAVSRRLQPVADPTVNAPGPHCSKYGIAQIIGGHVKKLLSLKGGAREMIPWKSHFWVYV
jgi:hypothetical protein